MSRRKAVRTVYAVGQSTGSSMYPRMKGNEGRRKMMAESLRTLRKQRPGMTRKMVRAKTTELKKIGQ